MPASKAAQAQKPKTPAKKVPAKKAAKRAPRKRGRPTLYTPELANEICKRLALGLSLRKICQDEKMPHRDTVMDWIFTKPGFSDQYAIARERQTENMLEEIIEIADDGSNDTYEDEEGRVRVDTDVIQRSRLRVDTRKWAMSKLAPKRYGDKLDLNHGGQKDNPLVSLIQQVSGSAFTPVGSGEPEPSGG